MIVYHGTTLRRARLIRIEGFRPKSPSRRVWFTQNKGYARRRARHKARSAGDRPVVLACDLDLRALRQRLGANRVKRHRRIVVVEGPVPPSVLLERSSGPTTLIPAGPAELAGWINRLLVLGPREGVEKSHPGVDRLARWIEHRTATYPNSQLKKQEVVEAAGRWLQEYFREAEPDFGRLAGWPAGEPPGELVEEGPQEPEADPRSGDCRNGQAFGGRRAGVVQGRADRSGSARAVMTSRQLDALDPDENREIFEMALYDANPEVARAARKLTEGKGFGQLAW